MAKLTILSALLVSLGITHAARLAVSGTDLTYNGQTVYLSGANAAWNIYGYDFGNGQYDGSLEPWMADIGAAGGNAFRIWVHVEGYNTPVFDADGYVTACDNTGQFIGDVQRFLDAAQANNILVTLCLWNSAGMSNQNHINLILDDAKMESYFSNCLAPLARTLAGHPALAAYESINEPEGSVLIAADSNPCYDTTIIGQSGSGWTGVDIPMERFLRFMGRINQVVKENDPDVLVTVGCAGQFPISDAFSNTRNHYTDECLNGAAGGPGAGLDFVQVHTYDWGTDWSPNAPFTVNAADYGLSKPIVIGEFASICPLNTSLPELHQRAFDTGYSGTWTWHWAATGVCSDTQDIQRQGLATLAGLPEVDITVG